jgi:hypothetical protein
MIRPAVLLIAVLFPVVLSAQPSVSVSSFSFSSGIHPTLSFQFEGTDVRFVEAWWKDELKRISREVSTRKEVIGHGALLPQVSRDTVRILVKAEQRKGAPFTAAHVAILTTEGWLSPASEEKAFEAGKAFVQERSTLLRRQLAQQELTLAEKGLARLNSELATLQRDKERAEAGIEKARQRAAEAADEQVALAREAEDLEKRIAAQRKESSEEPGPAGEKALAELTKQSAKCQDRRRKAVVEEAQQREKADELAWQVRRNQEEQERKRTDIARQEQLVGALRAKLEAIR